MASRKGGRVRRNQVMKSHGLALRSAGEGPLLLLLHGLGSSSLDWQAQIEQRYRAFVADAQQRGLDARYDCTLEIDSWHVLQPLRPFGGVGNWR